jgi:hypothetical protein
VRIFVYVLTFDSGFAPNPFHGWCTLACCKPGIRRKAHPGDWIVGLTPRADGNRVAYAMKVDETLSFKEYWSDRRFRAKRPRQGGVVVLEKCGDNCYEATGDGKFRQLPSAHWDKKNDREDLRRKKIDLGGKCVLVSRRFCYRGADAKPIPAHVIFKTLPQRFYRVNFTQKEEAALRQFLEALPQGVHGRPRDWAGEDASWKVRPPRCG